VVRHRKFVGREVVGGPEVGVVGVGAVLRAGLPATSLAVLGRLMAGGCGKTAMKDNV